jgi:hypothetical protein
MPRIRSIKPEFWQDSRMANQPALVRLVFVCLWSMADDAGRMEGDALAVWRFGSFREDSREVASALDTLRGLSRVLLYEVGGNPYIQIVNFNKHQRIDHASDSKYPEYTNGCDLLQDNSRSFCEPSRILAPDLEQGAGSREQGAGIKEQGTGNREPRGTRLPDGLKILVDLGVDEQIAKDWLAVRKAKRAPLTQTAVDDLVREAGKARITVADAVRMCAQRSWQGFKADWLKSAPNGHESVADHNKRAAAEFLARQEKTIEGATVET